MRIIPADLGAGRAIEGWLLDTTGPPSDRARLAQLLLVLGQRSANPTGASGGGI
jgi:hypothetical protein